MEGGTKGEGTYKVGAAQLLRLWRGKRKVRGGLQGRSCSASEIVEGETKGEGGLHGRRCSACGTVEEGGS